MNVRNVYFVEEIEFEGSFSCFLIAAANLNKKRKFDSFFYKLLRFLDLLVIM